MMHTTKPVDEALLDLDSRGSELADVLFNSEIGAAKKSRAFALKFIERSLRDLVTQHMNSVSALPRQSRRRVAALIIDKSRKAFLQRWGELEGGVQPHG
jgi:hypothetical protein